MTAARSTLRCLVRNPIHVGLLSLLMSCPGSRQLRGLEAPEGGIVSALASSPTPTLDPPRTHAASQRASLSVPTVGFNQLRILAPNVLELFLVTTKRRGQRLERWDFADSNHRLHLPSPEHISVTVNGQPVAVTRLGFRRRVLYAPLAHRDLRIGNSLYLELATPVQDDGTVRVTNPSEALWPREATWEASASAQRLSPVIHVNQVGYAPTSPKHAFAGAYLGSLGELILPEGKFMLLEETNRQPMFEGTLHRRVESHQPFAVAPYQHVLEADFTRFNRPGRYVLSIPGLGTSYPFDIDAGVDSAIARTYALGLYHQRCGESLTLPFTRFVHDRCHAAPAEVPGPQLQSLREALEGLTKDYQQDPRHTAPPLRGVSSSLLPFIRSGRVDVSGGHHDAGDYGKYTFNSAQLIHELMIAVDALPGVADLDNLGIPESGDGIGDVEQIARREADFLAKMQDSDGGFYFLVHPRNRAYEGDALPDKGDPQIVFPKNSVVTAAAVAALAQIGSSPRFRKDFPAVAQRYLEGAQRGWSLLERTIQQHGKDGSYQRIGHYGDTFMHDDELVWAATEMYLATGDREIHRNLLASFDPSSPATVQWTWVRMFESYGAAIRSYALAPRSGRQSQAGLDPIHLARCRQQVLARAQDLVGWATDNAYGTSFPEPTKRFRTAGWYFSFANTFDLVTAYVIDPKPVFLDVIATNTSFELGGNPNNVTFLTGLGWHRQREIVHQYAQNDRRILPPTGIPLGSVQGGFAWLPPYENELGELSYPSDGDADNPYPPYDRWADSFNVTTEFTVDTLGRSLASAAWLMARGPMRGQPWKSAPARITVVPSPPASRELRARLVVEGLDVDQAQVVWEASGQEPQIGNADVLFPTGRGSTWIEAEALWRDGRRVSAAAEL